MASLIPEGDPIVPRIEDDRGANDMCGVAGPHTCHNCGRVYSVAEPECSYCAHRTLTVPNLELCEGCALGKIDYTLLLAASVKKVRNDTGRS